MNLYLNALMGGIIIGVAVAMMMIFKGRILGISGLVGSVISPVKGEFGWRIAAILGLMVGGFTMNYLRPELVADINYEPLKLIVAGLLVGVGTQMGSGCTSGHGICGISRFSNRSIVATLTFMIAGIIAVAVKGVF